MRIDVTLWYRLITKGVITPNCYDGNSTISSTVPTSPTPSHYLPYDVNQSDGIRPTDSGAYAPSSPSFPHYDEVNINQSIIARKRFGFHLGYIIIISSTISSSSTCSSNEINLNNS